jgi:hypothetical protein
MATKASSKPAAVPAVTRWRTDVQAVTAVEAEAEAAQRAWRRATRDAVATGEAPPERDFDPDVLRARREVASEDAQTARDELARTAVDCLTVCRERRDELDAVACSANFRRVLWAGIAGGLAALHRQVAERAQALTVASKVETLGPEPTHEELEDQEALNV